MHCDDTLKLNERLIRLNSERDNLRDKRRMAIFNLDKIMKREDAIDTEEDAINARMKELENLKKSNVRQINQITERTKDIMKHSVFHNCTFNIE